jgi:hypothetical protein
MPEVSKPTPDFAVQAEVQYQPAGIAGSLPAGRAPTSVVRFVKGRLTLAADPVIAPERR